MLATCLEVRQKCRPTIIVLLTLVFPVYLCPDAGRPDRRAAAGGAGQGVWIAHFLAQLYSTEATLTEHEIQNSILRAFGTRADLRLWRANTGAARFGRYQVRFGIPGKRISLAYCPMAVAWKSK